VGAGLAFAESTAPNWQETMEMRTLQATVERRASIQATHVEVEVRLQDVLDQGACSTRWNRSLSSALGTAPLPAGEIKVREVK
jgi:hypothetical protein